MATTDAQVGQVLDFAVDHPELSLRQVAIKCDIPYTTAYQWLYTPRGRAPFQRVVTWLATDRNEWRWETKRPNLLLSLETKHAVQAHRQRLDEARPPSVVVLEPPGCSMPISPGRPKHEVDIERLRDLRDKGYGFKRIASEYIRLTGEYINHSTVRDRLVEAAETEKPAEFSPVTGDDLLVLKEGLLGALRDAESVGEQARELVSAIDLVREAINNKELAQTLTSKVEFLQSRLDQAEAQVARLKEEKLVLNQIHSKD